jgi:signal transduction histidine kinase
MFTDVLRHRSGRVIALARAVLATAFLFAIWIDPARPTQSATATYAVLGFYVAAAIGLTIVIWNSWWFDAKLALAAHIIDIAAFTLLVVATDGYTSPFFVFFVFLVLSAAIRWGWRETALTAAAVILLYFAAGLAGGDVAGANFDLQRFIIRSSNLVILSALLIWFGINHGFSSLGSPNGDLLGEPSPRDPPLETAIERAARVASAGTALLIWRASGAKDSTALSLVHEELGTSIIPDARLSSAKRPFLFDIRRDRAFSRGPYRRMEFSAATRLIDSALSERFNIEEGLALPIRTDAGEGLLLLCSIDGLCTDHVEFGDTLASAVSAYLQRHALLAAVQEGATARARLSLARDLHDSIVQFLAGATFRVEAIKRSIRSGERPERELQDLKELLLQEQQELRSAVGALRADNISFPKLAADLETLCQRLARQWDITCNFSADVPDVAVPMRLHLDTHQLVRESVANAVRHAKATSVNVEVWADDNDLRLDVSNDGSANVRLKAGSPWSLRERVDDADGTLMLATRDTGTSVSITLPLKPEARP